MKINLQVDPKEIKFVAPECAKGEFLFRHDYKNQDGTLYHRGMTIAELKLEGDVWVVRNWASDTEDRYRSPIIGEPIPASFEGFEDIQAKAIHTLATFRDHGWRRDYFRGDDDLTRDPAFGGDDNDD